MGSLSKKIGKVKGLIGSIKGDGNAFTSQLGFGDFSNKFDQRINDGLNDLLGGALGIRMSQVPEISAEVLKANEKQRLDRQKAVTTNTRKETPGSNQVTLQYPLNYFKESEDGIGKHTGFAGRVELDFPNAIHFKSLDRKEQEHFETMNKGIGNLYGWAPFTGQTDAELRKNADFGDWGSVRHENETIYDIFLHLPDKLQDEVKVEYSEAKGGAMQRFFARLFTLGDDVQKMSGEGNLDWDEFLASLKGMLPGGDIMQKVAGHMTNPVVFQTLKNVNFRSYNYSFKLMPTSPQEADIIKQIIFAFKMSMLPGTAGENNGIWTLPNEWAINFEGPIRNWIDFPLTAVCTSASVEYGPHLMAAGNDRGDGEGAPSSMTLQLSFIETMQLSRQRFAREVAPTENRESKAESGTKLGILALYTPEELEAKRKADVDQYGSSARGEDAYVAPGDD